MFLHTIILSTDYFHVFSLRMSGENFPIGSFLNSIKSLCRKREIRLREVEHKEGGDYYLQINSPTKELKESSMKRQFRERFESELQKAKDALTKKGGTKVYDKVVERVGRAMGRYPSIAKFYEVTYTRSTKKNGSDV